MGGRSVKKAQEEIEQFLTYIPQTFPHYTQHTIGHSKQIIERLSLLLFEKNKKSNPVIKLTGVETYILIMCALLHDSGMVSSDEEKSQILMSNEWEEWLLESKNKKYIDEIEQLRGNKNIKSENVRNFLADLNLRYLIAEFIRRKHHLRLQNDANVPSEIVKEVCLKDPVLIRTIIDVCVAHGLNQNELKDNDKFPYDRSIRGENVNVKLLAILLRIGDLLDISSQRSCPLLLSLASPLPEGSMAHWTQYQCITHESITPKKIEILAECENASEHRLLKDWFQWLIDEIKNANLLLKSPTRENLWFSPVVEMNETIKIIPKKNASYVYSDWRFELDNEKIFERLIYDAYDSPFVFIRELIQNSLDATRCKMYIDYEKDQKYSLLESPEKFPEEIRNNYPINISLKFEKVINQYSKNLENKLVLEVDDAGIGMDKDVIERYFLQVGKSYYTSNDFIKKHRFIPSSKFGIGFLSVFAVSKKVIVETFKTNVGKKSEPLQLTLIGPRNYLLYENSKKEKSGTTVKVYLDVDFKPGQLIDWINNICVAVEFPLFVQDHEMKVKIKPEIYKDNDQTIEVIGDPTTQIILRSYPVQRQGINGFLYTLIFKNEKGEHWNKWWWINYVYLKENPLAKIPFLPKSFKSFNGIVVSNDRSSFMNNYSECLDYRTKEFKVPISRWSNKRFKNNDEDSKIISRWAEILNAHIAQSPFSGKEYEWEYKQQLIENYPFYEYWLQMPKTVKVFKEGKSDLISLNELIDAPDLTTIVTPKKAVYIKNKEIHYLQTKPEFDNKYMTIIDRDLEKVAGDILPNIFLNKNAKKVRLLSSGHLAVDWSKKDIPNKNLKNTSLGKIEFINFEKKEIIGFPGHKISKYNELVFLNLDNPAVKWLQKIIGEYEKGTLKLNDKYFENLIDCFVETVKNGSYKIKELIVFIENWKNVCNKEELKFPDIKIQKENFELSFSDGFKIAADFNLTIF